MILSDNLKSIINTQANTHDFYLPQLNILKILVFSLINKSITNPSLEVRSFFKTAAHNILIAFENINKLVVLIKQQEQQIYK